jgi:hypothetical protein
MTAPIGRQSSGGNSGSAKLDKMSSKELSKLMSEQLKEALPDGWPYNGSPQMGNLFT